MHFATKIVTISAVGIVALGLTVVPAVADPTVKPTATDIVSAGAIITQGLDSKFSTDFNATAPTSKYYSWDETGTSPITPKTGASSITRPYGSTGAIGVLEHSTHTHTTLDIARASRGPQLVGYSDPRGSGDYSTDWFVSFAKDAVGWAGYTGGNAPATLSVDDLRGIYGTCTITKWNQITDIPGYIGGSTTIKAYLPYNPPDFPQYNNYDDYDDNTRQAFLEGLGLFGVGSCVQSAMPTENEGTNAVFTGNKDAIFPYSIGHYVAQKYKGKSSGSDAPGALDALRAIKFSSTSTIAQVITTGQTCWGPVNMRACQSAPSMNAPFGTTQFGHGLYQVVRSSDWNDPILGPRLKKLLDTSAHGGWICLHGASDITGYGFLRLPTNQCGLILHD